MRVGRGERPERVHRFGGAVLLDETDNDVAVQSSFVSLAPPMRGTDTLRPYSTHMRMTAAITPPSIQDSMPNDTAKQATRTRTCRQLPDQLICYRAIHR